MHKVLNGDILLQKCDVKSPLDYNGALKSHAGLFTLAGSGHVACTAYTRPPDSRCIMTRYISVDYPVFMYLRCRYTAVKSVYSCQLPACRN